MFHQHNSDAILYFYKMDTKGREMENIKVAPTQTPGG